MAKEWAAASARFLEQTGQSLDAKHTKSLDQVIAEYEQIRQGGGNEESSKTAKAKSYTLEFLQFFKLVDGIAASAAGVVFPAAGFCNNAAVYLLDIPQTIHSFHELIESVFEELSPSLGSFRTYGKMEQYEKIGEELRIMVNQLLMSFVDICAIVVKFRQSGKWRKMMTNVEALLDKGVHLEIKTATRKFKTQAESHHHVQSTESLKTLREIHESIPDIKKMLHESSDAMARQLGEVVAGQKRIEDQRKSEDEKRKYLDNIRKKLGVADLQEKQLKLSIERCETLFRTAAEGAGKWLQLENPGDSNSSENSQLIRDLGNWMEMTQKSNSALCALVGEAQTGKSVIMSKLQHDLDRKYRVSEGQSLRTCIASYFAPDPNSAQQADRDKQADYSTIKTALACMVYQIAEKDRAFAKRVSKACEEKSDDFFRDASWEQLWDVLSLGKPTDKSAHFLLFDGLVQKDHADAKDDDSPSALIQVLSEKVSSQANVKIIVSTRGKVHYSHIKPSPLQIMVADHSAPDIKAYIERTLRERELFQEQDDGSKRIKDKILNELSIKVEGSFRRAKSALAKIEDNETVGRPEANIDRILDDAHIDTNDSAAEIQRLQERLTADEILEVNELLFLQSGKQFRGNNLEKKISKLYREVFVIKKGSVMVRDGVEKLLEEESEMIRHNDGNPKFSATITISRASISTVQSFLWHLMDSSRSEFTLANDSNESRSIRVNLTDSSISIIRAAFKYLEDSPDESTVSAIGGYSFIGQYLLVTLPDHLETLEESLDGKLDALSEQHLREIGEGLLGLLIPNDNINRHWKSYHAVEWHKQKSEVTIFLRWLKDSRLQRLVGRFARSWIEEVRRDEFPEFRLLQEILKAVARNWLQDEKWEVLDCLGWLRGGLAMKDSDVAMNSTPTATVEDVESWCRDVLHVQSPDALWQRRLGETYSSETCWEKAIEALEKSIQLAPDKVSVDCIQMVAICLGESGKRDQALAKMDEALKMFNENQTESSESVGTYVKFSQWYLNNQHFERAIHCAQKAMAIDDSSLDAWIVSLQSRILGHQDDNAITDLLEKARQKSEGQPQPTLLSQILKSVTTDRRHDETLLKCLSLVSSDTQATEYFIQELTQATKPESEQDQDLLGLSHLVLGIALYFFNRQSTKKYVADALEVQHWEHCLALQDSHDVHPSAFLLLSAHYFEEARTTTATGPTALAASLEKLISKRQTIVTKEIMTSYLASHYTERQDLESARTVLRPAVEIAFIILSNDTEDDDWYGYKQLAMALARCGDDLNALTAFSTNVFEFERKTLGWLIEFDGPELGRLSQDHAAILKEEASTLDLIQKAKSLLGNLEQRTTDTDDHTGTETDHDSSEIDLLYDELIGKLRLCATVDLKNAWGMTRLCDGGGCKRVWDYDNAMNMCKYCNNCDFCDECLAKLKQHAMVPKFLGGLACRADHQWLRLPAWDRERFWLAVEKNVVKGGELENGARVGGEKTTADAWLRELMASWNWTPDQKDEEGKGEDGEERGGN
ncbi:hypothetical protein GGR57DRAFT_517251 [Xylariaceae sp. FL1272]|nr:hypothetical protein GGR57DRAFT_517251 [Xylariaceae sp. FL1272]